MTDAGFRNVAYDWRGATEWMLVFDGITGPPPLPGRGTHPFDEYRRKSPQVVLIQPLFEEMNFLRTFIVDIARSLAAMGIGSWLPDLPGTGESMSPLRDIGWDDWRGALRAAGETIAADTGSRPHVAAFRGGALLGDAIDAPSWWSYAPATGASLLRYLQRTQLVSDLENELEPTDIKDEICFYGGYEISRAMRDALEAAVEPAVAGPRRTVPAGPGTPLWRRAEPGRDRMASALLADDIAAWIATCADR